MSAAATDISSSEANRRTLFELLAMYAIRNKCQDVLDPAGLGGNIKPSDTVYIRGHTGLWLGVNQANEIICNKADRTSAAAVIVEAKFTTPVKHGSRVAFRISDPSGGASKLWLSVAPGGDVRATPQSGSSDIHFVVQAFGESTGVIVSGNTVILRAGGNAKHLEVEGEAVRARTTDRGTMQRLVVEKVPAPSEVPAACSDRDLSIQDQAWLLRRGVQLALLDKQALARFISANKGGRPELLKHYTMLWEAEWRLTRPNFADAGAESGGSPASGRSRKSTTSNNTVATTGGRRRSNSRPRARTMDRLFDMFTGVSADDKVNSDMFCDALRSFFATAMRLSQLEADPVQRVVEAFASALVNDKSFMEVFKQSMLPEKERKTYTTPEEVLFSLTYTTMMLNTDTHNQQVAQKVLDTKKFVAAGKDCGVQGGLMLQIYKNVQKDQL